ncbi:gamma-glutamylcyclotransferase [Halorubellus sp. JP-L1]|uniref:gamma-glutamylcyclotransferase family protein n=1 Tax=Halorubellus sp. JP-L1 TaxID=2715753 RepID=UPI00140A1579|nr:gamma-glutamylcyclotransferase [Halorubellus sp. JP-L1]
MHVFVYGTLTDPDRVAAVLGDAGSASESGDAGTASESSDGDWSFVGDATLQGLHRVDGDYPTLAPGGSVTGRILRTDQVAALDTYEGVDRGLYVRVAVPAVERERDAHDWWRGVDEVAVYVGDPDRLGVADAVSWPEDGDFRERVHRCVDATDVAVGPR